MIYEKCLEGNGFSIWEITDDKSDMRCIYCNDPDGPDQPSDEWEKYVKCPVKEISFEEAFIDCI